ncbi:Fungal specific transcription factor domain containing protein [Ceratobasidium theobromae]|uniref:Fungal specific transcription factor domain containing protein n=1 Tax=Ceratobasidium theobromae TaxID=1582974 RepID=A0A5N5QFP5_9AGAM|nr:Fungal specific transcription factor domain containing protein [Ceratobasidium theobromae]
MERGRNYSQIEGQWAHASIVMGEREDVFKIAQMFPATDAASQEFNVSLASELPAVAPKLSNYAVIADLKEVNEEIDRILERYTRLSLSRRPYWEIQEVLERLANVTPTFVATDFARAAIAWQNGSATRGEEYWQEGPSSNLVLRGLINERGRVPDILLNNILEPREANELFDRFMRYWNVWSAFFLHVFTLLTIASRDYPDRPSLYHHLSQQARLSATAALTDGLKSADTVQALLLIAAYPPPVQRFADDRTSLFAGMALRMAMDLTLHLASYRTPGSNSEALELINHTRTWNACLLLDSWNAIKHGLLPTLREPEHVVIRTPDTRSLQTEFEHRIFKVVNHFMQFAKAGQGVDYYIELTRNFNTDIGALRDEIHRVCRRAEDSDQPNGRLRRAILMQVVDYARMVVYSFGFTQTLQQGDYWGGEYLMMCLDAATSSVRGALEQLTTLQFYKYSPDAWFEYAAFSAAFLLKLLRPQFKDRIEGSQCMRIADYIKRLVNMYRSPAVALQFDNHLPRVLAQFLESAACHLPEYAASTGPRGLSRTSRNVPSPPHATTPAGGFGTPPVEALMAALSSTFPEWWAQVDQTLPGLQF